MNPRTCSRIPKILRISAYLLVPWIVFMTVQWLGEGGKRDFDGSWIGLDLAELAGMLLVAKLFRVRHRTASPVAAATGTLLTLDAWFDYMSAMPKLESLEAVAMAVFAELPLGILLLWVAWRALDSAGPAGAADRVEHTELAP